MINNPPDPAKFNAAEKTAYGVALGKVTAIVEDLGKVRNKLFPAMVARERRNLDGPLLETMTAHLDQTDPWAKLLVDAYEELHDAGGCEEVTPIHGHQIQGPFWIAYYKQKSSNYALKERIALGKRIAKKREELGMNVTDLAEKSGISRNHIHHIEAANHAYSFDAAVKVCEVLGLKINIEDKN